MDLNHIISNNLRNLRNERNLSLGQLAELSGVSKVMLSQIEKGESNPTINTIWKIAMGLKVPYTRLIDEAADNAVVIRKCDSVKQFENNDSLRVYCYYTSNPNRNFELFNIELWPNSCSESNGHSPKTQEYIFVTKGELTLEVNNMEYILLEGDSIQFECSCPHSYKNNRGIVAEFIDIIYYF